MVWTLVAFVICLVVLKKYAFGPVQKGIDARRDYIRSSIEEADRAREEAKSLLEEHRALIGQAKSQAEDILGEARRLADTQQALGEIRREVAELSLLAAEKITRKTLTGPDQQRLIDEALAEIDFSELEASRS
jgi:F-type H+-transporting ATPase subunit b